MTVEKTDTQSRHRAHFTAIRRQRNSKAATKMETCSSETETLHILGAPNYNRSIVWGTCKGPPDVQNQSKNPSPFSISQELKSMQCHWVVLFVNKTKGQLSSIY